MRSRAIVVMAALLAGLQVLTSCVSLLDGSDTTRLHFSGVIRTAAGTPISGAETAIVQGTFVFSGAVVSDTTGADGRYDLRADVRCTEGEDIRGGDEQLSTYYLVVRAAGYEERSNINIGRNLLCISAEQTADFSLPLRGS